MSTACQVGEHRASSRIMTVAWILSLLVSLPPAYADRYSETEDAREVRMDAIARAVHDATSKATCTGRFATDTCEALWSGRPEHLAMLLVTKGWWESRYALNVHEGNCKPWECDAGKARTPWQLQHTSFSAPDWDDMVGVDFESTRRAAWSAAKVLAVGMRRCHSFHGALSWYASTRCSWSGAANRMVTYKRLTKIPMTYQAATEEPVE